MSKRREVEQNWYTLPYDDRNALMREHGASGRTFAGRVLQVVTGSAGIDDYEWGVTLFGVRPDDLKEVVYTMRYDRASAVYAEFGSFYAGMVTPLDDLLAGI
jgi:chlorite dismutase